jgi:hypothetical protein
MVVVVVKGGGGGGCILVYIGKRKIKKLTLKFFFGCSIWAHLSTPL